MTSFRSGVFLVIYACMHLLVSYASMYFLLLVYSFIFIFFVVLLVHYLPVRPTTRRGEKRLRQLSRRLCLASWCVPLSGVSLDTGRLVPVGLSKLPRHAPEWLTHPRTPLTRFGAKHRA